MPTLQTLAAFQGSLRLFLGAPQPSGFCTRCERVSRWEDRSSHYRCSNCGSDPVVDSDGLTGPASVVAAEPPREAPVAPAPPSRRRWAERFPTRRGWSEPLWTTFSSGPSLTR